ncbi:MAG: preprotein translocase subunit YajC [SAR86 cluster bacterium]|mgnify:FL=1|jgi:preprotein translocase subunit YajC|nr:preprotein translocase subunit YajC [SAR86 cluster bacterium]HIC27277.1 preprotein translocase subunit YajC [Gammaproteobacteria bacterium]
MNGVTTFFNPTFLLLIGFFVLIYFLMIRPQNKAKKAHEEMVNGIEVGDEVVSSGGLLGRVTKISDQFFEVNLGDNTKVKIQRASITNVLPKGTINSI